MDMPAAVAPLSSLNVTVSRLYSRPPPVFVGTELVAYFISTVSLLCYVVLVLVVKTKSPKEMGAYKWYVHLLSEACAS